MIHDSLKRMHQIGTPIETPMDIKTDALYQSERKRISGLMVKLGSGPNQSHWLGGTPSDPHPPSPPRPMASRQRKVNTPSRPTFIGASRRTHHDHLELTQRLYEVMSEVMSWPRSKSNVMVFDHVIWLDASLLCELLMYPACRPANGDESSCFATKDNIQHRNHSHLVIVLHPRMAILPNAPWSGRDLASASQTAETEKKRSKREM